MALFSRHLFLTASVACLSFTLAASPALAATAHKHKKHHVSHHAVHHHVSSESTIVRIAQRHLSNLGYYKGPVDGKMGPKTRDAIKRFQGQHGLKPNGVLTTSTMSAFERADPSRMGSAPSNMGQLMTHESVTADDLAGRPLNDDYAQGLNGGSRPINSRFARVDVSETGAGPNRRYNVNINGQPILVADGQPSVVGVSQPYDLGNEDAIIFTTFSPNESNCVYRNHVLSLRNEGSKLLDLDNCTRDYTAFSKNGSLFITFTQHDSNSAIGSTWRFEKGEMHKL